MNFERIASRFLQSTLDVVGAPPDEKSGDNCYELSLYPQSLSAGTLTLKVSSVSDISNTKKLPLLQVHVA